MNELRELLREEADRGPSGTDDLTAVLQGGRRRVRRRRAGVAATAVLATAGVLVGGSLALGPGSTGTEVGTADRPTPDAPTITLADARSAVEGEDYRLITSLTNDNLDRANGTYLDATTADGLVLLREGPRGVQNRERLALLDPATDERTWLSGIPDPPDELRPVELAADRLTFLGGSYTGGMEMRLSLETFDRGSGRWASAPLDLPEVDYPSGELGPDGRLYVRVPATSGQPPPGGWPTQAGGDAEDAGAEGDTYALYSVSLADPSDVRDEQLLVGDVAFTDEAMVWTDRTNGDAGQVHVRDLGTGEESSFDPRAGARCNLLSFGATDDRVVMGQYCGTYGDVRDDRVQVVDLDGDQVVTFQGSGVDGGLASGGFVQLEAYGTGEDAGSFVYDLDDERLLRLGEEVSKFALGGGPLQEGQLLWHTPVNKRHGATQWLAELTG